MKKIKAVFSILLIAVLLCSCSGEKVQADANSIKIGYTATYLVTTKNGAEYKNNYAISKNQDNKIQITSTVCEPYQTKQNGEEVSGEQVISSAILLSEQTLFPEKVEQTYTVSVNSSLNSRLEATFVKDQGYAMLYANKMLYTTDICIADLAYECGFTSPDYFIRLYKKHYGITPGAYRKKIRAAEENQQ